jgi:hypothetical protein
MDTSWQGIRRVKSLLTLNPDPTKDDPVVSRQDGTLHGSATQWMVAPEFHPRSISHLWHRQRSALIWCDSEMVSSANECRIGVNE